LQAPAFIRANTWLATPPLLPEIRLYLARDAFGLWERIERDTGQEQLPPPFWAFPWAGGQALARYLLDHPDCVRGRIVLDLASGSGLVAIAAAAAGTSSRRYAASATPNAPATPSRGAPRTASRLIASTRESTSRQVSTVSVPGSLVWSSSSMAGPSGGSSQRSGGMSTLRSMRQEDVIW